MIPKREIAFRYNCSLFAKALKHPFPNFLILPQLLFSDIYMVKDGKPSDRELEELSLKLGKKWKELGSCLEFDDAAITNLDEDNKELARKAYRMLLAWKQREGFQATYTVLYNALCDKLVECKLLAENFCCTEIEGNASP